MEERVRRLEEQAAAEAQRAMAAQDDGSPTVPAPNESPAPSQPFGTTGSYENNAGGTG
jgi:hypothetical protein